MSGIVRGAESLDHVRLQLKWRHQFQFAGYYAAQVRGYYAEEGLEVEFIEVGESTSSITAVIEGRADYGVSDTDVLLERLRGQPLVVCAAIFQHSPYVLLSRADRGIRTPGHLAGTRVMVASDQGATQFKAMLIKEGVDPNRVEFVPQSWSLDALIEGKVDAMSAYATVEPARLRARGIEPSVMSTLDYGVDFYGDTLFTTEAELAAHPKRMEKFLRATVRGWYYALNHPEQLADHILTLPGVKESGVTRELLMDEAKAMREFILPEVVEIGHMNPGRWQRIADTFASQGMVKAGVSLDGFIYTPSPLFDPRVLNWAIRIGIVLVLGALAVLVWILQMRRTVARRTRELREEAVRREKIEQKLRLSAERLSAAQSVAKLGSWETDLTTGLVIWSDETHGIFQTDAARFSPSHQAFLELVHPDDRLALDAAFVKSLTNSEPCVIEHRLLLADGTIKHVEERWRAYQGDDGRPLRATGTCQDITERKLAESEQRQLSERLRQTMETIGDAFYTLDREWRLTYVNREAERVLHRDRGSLLGRVLWDEFPGLAASRFGLEMLYSAREGLPAQVEEFYEPLNEWLEMRCFPSDLGLAVYLRDVTARRESEAQLRLLENSISRINDIVIITRASPLAEPGPEILFVNDAFVRLTGYSRQEALGRSPRFLQGPKTSREALDRIRAAITAGVSVHEEVVNYGKDGREYWLEINISPVADADGRITHLVAVERDVTERKKLEEQFLRAQRMESIGTLAGGIAHDLNNLLSPIIMGADLIAQFETKAETRLVLNNIQRSARRGAELVKQVLSFARGVEGARVSVRVEHIVHEIAGIVANTFPKKIVFSSNLPSDLWSVTGDPTQLNQVLLNLCVNARDAMKDGGRLTVSGINAEIDAQYAVMNRGVGAGRYVVLEVADTGTGMPKAVVDRIFEPFFTTKEVGSGTGLGLSTLLGIVRSHGGFVNVYSELGRGSVFKVYLPAQSVEPAGVSTEEGPHPLPRGNNELILVVDDESSIRSITQQTLEAFGYRVVTADDGAQAIALFAQRRGEIDLVITDMMMPVMDGPALISALRRLDQQVPIIAASGLNSNASMAKASSAGVRQFLSKPYNTESILKTIRAVLSEKSTDNTAARRHE
ncbi:MAG: ABC transporter substrate-binding protein [Opitutaceae bacterium]|nr:ABC transporter substrate-binding protein [Opitutaceae bacterium]